MRSTFTLFRSLVLSPPHLPWPRPFLFPRPCQFPRLAVTAPESQVLPSAEARGPRGPVVEVGELSAVPEEWRRARLAWLCKELPAHKAGTLVRILNAQKKWMRQEDATYVLVHCLRVRENETAFKIRRKMIEIMVNQTTSCDLKEVIRKLIPEMIGKEIEKATSFLAKGGDPDWFCCMQWRFWIMGTRIIQKSLTFLFGEGT